MSHTKFINKSLFSWIFKAWFMGIALCARVTSEEKVEAPSSGLFCISDCSTCPVICSPPPPPPPPILITTSHPPPPSPHSPSSLPYLSSPPHSSGTSPPPPTPLKPYNTPSSGLAQPQPTVISAPHDFSYPYYYFYAAGASSLSIHAPFLVLLLFLTLYSVLGNQ